MSAIKALLQYEYKQLAFDSNESAKNTSSLHINEH